MNTRSGHLIRKYSDYIHYPIKMMVSKHRIKPGDEDKKPEDRGIRKLSGTGSPQQHDSAVEEEQERADG